MIFSTTVLGTASAIPSSKRNPPSQIVHIHSHTFLVDCGEGTQIQMRRNHIRLSKINHIFISHLHADHVLGILGLLSTYALLGRVNSLHIYANERLEELIKYHQEFFNNKFSYEIIFHPLIPDVDGVIFEDDKLFVKAFPLKHSVPSHGFLFAEKKRLRKIDKSKISFYSIPVSKIKEIKEGADFVTEQGQLIRNKDLTFDVPRERSYAYCSDTAYFDKIIQYIKGVDILYHESTFCNEDLKRAYQTQHSTSEQAARIAQKANVGRLLLGHFSTRYKNLDTMLDEALKVFKNTEIAKEKEVYTIEEQNN